MRKHGEFWGETMQVWLNGQFLPSDAARVGVSSAGLTMGWGIFTTIGVWRARPFALDRHLARLRSDAARTQVGLDCDDRILEDALHDLIERNLAHRATQAHEMQNIAQSDFVAQRDGVTQSDGVARITVTRRGDGRWNDAPGSDVCLMFRPRTHELATKSAASPIALHNEVSAQIAPILASVGAPSTHGAAHSKHAREARAQSEENAEAQGVRLMMSPSRVESRRALCGVKSTSYGDYTAAWREAVARGFDEAVLRNERGALCEGTRSSLFWTLGGELRTPALRCGALPGIARAIVLDWAQDDAIPVREGVFSPRELDGADEIFLTSAAQGPRAVARWNNGSSSQTLAAPGPLTSHFTRRWNLAVSQD